MPPERRVASHQQVFRIVKEQNIHAADDLFKLAQEQSAKGDHRLLLYCGGETGMKANLQGVIDALWKPDPGITEGAASDAAEHLAPLSQDRLQQLKSWARSSPGCTDPLPTPEITSSRSFKHIGCIRDAKVAPCPPRPKAPAGKRKRGEPKAAEQLKLLDQYGLRAEVVVRPRAGRWRLRDFYEVLAVCRSREAALEGMAPSPSPEGGFVMRRTEAGWHAMLREGHAPQRKPFGELSDTEQRAARGEVRFGLGCGAMPWRSAGTADQGQDDAWIDEMPLDPCFHEDSLLGTPEEERLVRVFACKMVEDKQWLALLRGFEACGHTLQQTVGFKFCPKEGMQITGSKARSTRHKHGVNSRTSFGVICAQACAAEERSEGGPIVSLLGAGRSGTDCPQFLQSTADKLLKPESGSGMHVVLADKPQDSPQRRKRLRRLDLTKY